MSPEQSLFDAGTSELPSCPIHPVSKAGLDDLLAGLHERARAWSAANHFKAKRGKLLAIPGAGGVLERVLFGVPERPDLWSWACLREQLPAGQYFLEGCDAGAAADAALAWMLAGYRFSRYKPDERELARLAWPAACERAALIRAAEGVFTARDLVNTPAEDMGPGELAGAVEELAGRHGALFSCIEGDDLLAEGYPCVHAVGRAASRAPRLADLTWGDPDAPRVTLVGKGVVFDSGGLDLKSAAGMKLMKKDMGGAASVIGLAHGVMAAGLPIRLRVLVPCVENAVAGNAFRPLDVLATRAGKTVEVGNTDAEGRLILCDALSEADSEDPQLILDFATLTGAARVALGSELPALFCSDDSLAEELLAAGLEATDPLWRLPLHDVYRRHLDSPVADLNNISSARFGGAITAALFLREFVSKGRAWAHVDTMAWNESSRPGRPVGGEAFGMRAALRALEQRFLP